jgi:hypothetical protein
MPGPVLTVMSTVQCAHLGKGTPAPPNPRILIDGQAVVTITTKYAIALCQLPTTSGGNLPPCLSGTFTTASTRVLTDTGFLLLADSQGTSLPNVAPLVVKPSQFKVVAT